MEFTESLSDSGQSAGFNLGDIKEQGLIMNRENILVISV